MADVRVLVVGTYASVNAWANDQGWVPEEDYWVVTSAADLRKISQQVDTNDVEVYITYGWRVMPSSKALEIADFLTTAGIDRAKWRYV